MTQNFWTKTEHLQDMFTKIYYEDRHIYLVWRMFYVQYEDFEITQYFRIKKILEKSIQNTKQKH